MPQPLKRAWARASSAGALRLLGGQLWRVEPEPEFLAGLEIGNELFRHLDLIAGARISAGPGWPVLHGEGAEATQFHAVPPGKRARDLLEDHVHDLHHVPLHQVGISFRELFDQFRFNHWGASVFSILRVPNRE